MTEDLQPRMSEPIGAESSGLEFLDAPDCSSSEGSVVQPPAGSESLGDLLDELTAHLYSMENYYAFAWLVKVLRRRRTDVATGRLMALTSLAGFALWLAVPLLFSAGGAE